MSAISAIGLTKTYAGLFRRQGQQALRGLELEIPRGAAFGLIGPNGAGKTTFIKILLGVVRPTSGEVRILGKPPEDLEARARVGYLPERLHLPHAWKPLEFLASVARLKGKPFHKRDLEALIDRVGLNDAVGRKIGGYSKGMRQRLGLAAALIGEPELLILDEPTDGIDPLGRVEVRKILQAELRRGATLFLNSHLLAETERVCARVGILSHGKLVREGTLDELCRLETRWRVRFAPGAPNEALVKAGFAPARDGLFTCDAETPEALNARLDEVRAAGALILSLERDERDLEDVLADAVQGAAEPLAPPAREAAPVVTVEGSAA